MDSIWQLISFSSNSLDTSSCDVALSIFGFSTILLRCLKLLLYNADTVFSCRRCKRPNRRNNKT